MSTTHFKTIDQLVDHYKNNNVKSNSITPKVKHDETWFMDWFVGSYCVLILQVLLKKTNIPSKYDLEIIKSASYFINSQIGGGTFKSIIRTYKNRKEV